jgi:hypothetical protein
MPLALMSLPARADEKRLWFWLEERGGPSLRLDVEVDQRRIRSATVPLCRRLRSEVPDHRTAALRLQTAVPRPIEWRGYRDDIERTAAGELLEVEIWEAGAEEGALILGVVVSTSEGILAHTHLVADPAAPAKVSLAEGIVLRSAPVPAPRPPEQP